MYPAERCRRRQIGLIDVSSLQLESGAVIDACHQHRRATGQIVARTGQRGGGLARAHRRLASLDPPVGHPTPAGGTGGRVAPIDTTRWCAVATSSVLGTAAANLGQLAPRPEALAGLKISR